MGNGQAAHAWKLDYPVTPHDAVEDDLYVLRIWCNADRTSRPFGAERVARVIAPILEDWLSDADTDMTLRVMSDFSDHNELIASDLLADTDSSTKRQMVHAPRV